MYTLYTHVAYVTIQGSSVVSAIPTGAQPPPPPAGPAVVQAEGCVQASKADVCPCGVAGAWGQPVVHLGHATGKQSVYPVAWSSERSEPARGTLPQTSRTSCRVGEGGGGGPPRGPTATEPAAPSLQRLLCLMGGGGETGVWSGMPRTAPTALTVACAWPDAAHACPDPPTHTITRRLTHHLKGSTHKRGWFRLQKKELGRIMPLAWPTAASAPTSTPSLREWAANPGQSSHEPHHQPKPCSPCPLSPPPPLPTHLLLASVTEGLGEGQHTSPGQAPSGRTWNGSPA